MTKPNTWKTASTIFLFCIATAMVSPAQMFKTLVHFSGTGYSPGLSPVQGPNGSLYGTTYYGGQSSCDDAYGLGCGVVYKVTSRGALTVLYNFSDLNLANGIFPDSLVLAGDGNF
jgi:uncharacterized repeat protein (TIGR03803 family)